MNRRIWLDILLLLALLVAAPLLLGWAYAGHRRVALTVDSLPVMLPSSGLHDLEPLVDRPGSFRWTNGRGRLRPPNPGGSLYLRITLSSGLDTATPATLSADGATIDLLVLPGLHTYAMLLPAQPGERVALTIESPTLNTDGRDLGVVVLQLFLAGNGPAPSGLLVPLLLASLGLYLLLRRVAMAPLVAAMLVLFFQIGCSLWQAVGLWRYALLGQLLLLVGAACLAALLIERVWPPVADEGRTTNDESRTYARSASFIVRPSSPTFTHRDWLTLGGLLLLGLALCLPWLGAPDPVGDLELSARRMGFMFQGGFAQAFSYGGDYMPFRLYILRLLSYLVLPLGGAFYEPLPAITRVIIKLPSLLAMLLSIVLIYSWARRYSSTRRAALLAGLYAISPPVWMNVAWWGQVDVLLSLPMVAAITLLDYARGRWSWLSWAAGLMIKPQAIILAPLLYVLSLRRYGPRGLLEGGGLAAGLIALSCAPFVLIGQGPGLYQAAVGSVGRFPQVTNRAYNLWWLIAEDRAISDLIQLGPLSYRSIGFLLVGVAALLTALAVLRRPDGPTSATAAATLALAFFALPTQIHERYAFFALPFLLLAAAADRRLLLPFAILVVTSTINIVGAISGFFPPLQHTIIGSPLPMLVAWVNLAVLLGLLAYLWIGRAPGWLRGAQPIIRV